MFGRLDADGVRLTRNRLGQSQRESLLADAFRAYEEVAVPQPISLIGTEQSVSLLIMSVDAEPGQDAPPLEVLIALLQQTDWQRSGKDDRDHLRPQR